MFCWRWKKEVNMCRIFPVKKIRTSPEHAKALVEIHENCRFWSERWPPAGRFILVREGWRLKEQQPFISEEGRQLKTKQQQSYRKAVCPHSVKTKQEWEAFWESSKCVRTLKAKKHLKKKKVTRHAPFPESITSGNYHILGLKTR